LTTGWPPIPTAIQTARLVLRPVSREDAEALLAGNEPPGLAFGEGFPSEGTVESMDLFIGARRAELPGFTPLHMIRRADGTAIGGIGYTPVAETRTVTVGYGISPAFEGQGYTTEALRGLIDWLFSAASLVRADTYVEHIASRRVMEKAGMQLIEEVDGVEDERPVRYVLYAIARPADGAQADETGNANSTASET
jgi:RimJ/RimL family protein N-acetyltransferase